MKFLCLICAEKVMEDMTADDAAQHYDEYAAFTADLRRSGQLVDCNRLLPTDTAVTVRVRNGKVATTDGPYAETKEQLAGFYMIDAKNLDEAIQIASRIPPARVGSIEVRPVRPIRETVAQAKTMEKEAQ